MRRAWLCGEDELTGRSFDHRKQWLQDRLAFLAECFAVDVLAFAIMSNHLHAILRNRPDIVNRWSHRDVAARWWKLFPRRRDSNGLPAEPTEAELLAMCANEEYIAERRRRLSSISWLMRCLCEPIARQANHEDECTGRFWQGRFRCQPLLDEAAILACAVYVDLNPIKARLAETPQTARFTSLFERIHARCEGRSRQSADVPPGSPMRSAQTNRAGWLSPIGLRQTPAELNATPRSRASDRGFLDMSEEAYEQLVTWAAAQLRQDVTRSDAPSPVVQLLKRWNLSTATFVEWVSCFSRLTRRAAGDDASLAREAQRCGRRWLQRSQALRRLFG